MALACLPLPYRRSYHLLPLRRALYQRWQLRAYRIKLVLERRG